MLYWNSIKSIKITLKNSFWERRFSASLFGMSVWFYNCTLVLFSRYMALIMKWQEEKMWVWLKKNLSVFFFSVAQMSRERREVLACLWGLLFPVLSVSFPSLLAQVLLSSVKLKASRPSGPVLEGTKNTRGKPITFLGSDPGSWTFYFSLCSRENILAKLHSGWMDWEMWLTGFCLLTLGAGSGEGKNIDGQFMISTEYAFSG